MNKYSTTDCLGYILLKAFGPIVRRLPLGIVSFLGARLGDLFYYTDLKHRAIVYANIKTALGEKITCRQIKKITRKFYQYLGSSILDIFIIPLVDAAYIKKYVTIEGLQNINKGLANGKGVLLVGVHEGSWEMYNAISSHLNFPFVLLVRGQDNYPRISKLLQHYRRHKDSKIIYREDQARQLILALKNNEAIGLSCDQGGRTGALVNFFGKNASMASGAIRLALKYDAVIIPVFYTRIKGPYCKIVIESALPLSRTVTVQPSEESLRNNRRGHLNVPYGELPEAEQLRRAQDLEKDIQDNLQRLTSVFERYIAQYPYEYLWIYKVWKYSDEKRILLLNDGKIGHLRQAQALAKIVSTYLTGKGINAYIDTLNIKFKNAFSQTIFRLSTCFSGKYVCQGCMWCFKMFTDAQTYCRLLQVNADIVISCGSSLEAINLVLSRQMLAKSMLIMRPALLSAKRFDLVVIPAHDRRVKGKNVVVTEGALNLIDEGYLREQSGRLIEKTGMKYESGKLHLGLLLGGDTKGFKLQPRLIEELIEQVKTIAEQLDAHILVSTSRRTSKEVEAVVKNGLAGDARCKLLIIANENNIPEAVGGILGLSNIVVTSADSISMISEAANSKKYVVVFNSNGLDAKHREFIRDFSQKGYISLARADGLAVSIDILWKKKPPIRNLSDNRIVEEGLKKIL